MARSRKQCVDVGHVLLAGLTNRRRSPPKGIDQATDCAPDEAQWTANEDPEQRALVRFWREDQRSEKSTAKTKRARDHGPRKSSREDAAPSISEFAPNPKRQQRRRTIKRPSPPTCHRGPTERTPPRTRTNRRSGRPASRQRILRKPTSWLAPAGNLCAT